MSSQREGGSGGEMRQEGTIMSTAPRIAPALRGAQCPRVFVHDGTMSLAPSLALHSERCSFSRARTSRLPPKHISCQGFRPTTSIPLPSPGACPTVVLTHCDLLVHLRGPPAALMHCACYQTRPFVRVYIAYGARASAHFSMCLCVAAMYTTTLRHTYAG